MSSRLDRSAHPSPASPAPLSHQRPTAAIAPECRHYLGDRPCKANRLCAGCDQYEPVSQRICIIKLGALGDVIRTLCLLPALRQAYPNSHLTWVSLPNGCRMIQDHPLIDRTLEFNALNAMVLTQESFDLLINLDKEPQPSSLAMAISAGDKRGIGMNAQGKPVPLNAQCEHYFNLGLSDEMKFRQNTRSYPQLVHEALGLAYDGQSYELPVNAKTTQRVRDALTSKGWRDDTTTLGVNVGSGNAFANKMWPVQRLADMIEQLHRQMPHVQIVLLGGAKEREVVDQLTAAISSTDAKIIDAGTDHDEPSFVSLVDCCDVVFCGDTMAMHVAIALGKQVVAFFGPTCEQEIDLFGRGEKLVSSASCSPCYKRNCDKDNVCVYEHSVSDAVGAIARAICRVSVRSLTLPVLPQRIAG